METLDEFGEHGNPESTDWGLEEVAETTWAGRLE